MVTLTKCTGGKEMEQLSAVTLKANLWEVLQDIKSGKMDAAKGDAIASQAREILRTTNTQLKILQQARESVSKELVNFAMPL